MSDSWQTTGGTSRLRTSIQKRAEKRTVTYKGDRTWTVDGDPKLGDAYNAYYVKLPVGERKYRCTCHSHLGGDSRSRRMCSHVAAVILHRDTHQGEIDDSKTPEVSPTKPRQLGIPLGPIPMPDWFDGFRPGQTEAITEIVDYLNAGKKVVFLSAPTGSGKTLIGDVVRRVYAPTSSVYAATTKTLQDQVLADFPYARVLKGRTNYRTLDGGEDITAAHCNRSKETLPACDNCHDIEAGWTWADHGEGTEQWHCRWCHPVDKCPYLVARDTALRSELPVVNVAYLLTSMNGPGWFTGRDLVIIDEADTLEGELMRHIEVVMGPRQRQLLRLGVPDKKTVESSWIKWVRGEAIPAVEQHLRELHARKTDVKVQARIRSYGALLDKLRALMAPVDGEPSLASGWVYTGYEDGRDLVAFKPVRVNRLAEKYLWRHGKQFLLMSATLVSPEQMAEDLGLEDDEWAVVDMASTFPVERRYVFVEATASMTFREKNVSWPKMAAKVAEVLDRHPEDRILVHTVSYELNRYLMEKVGDRRIVTYMSSQDREAALETYMNTENAVLFAPSFERGVDLREDLCRVIVLPKVPFPYLKDKQVSTRLHGFGRAGQAWYTVETVRTICQMTGRGMRAADDFCETYILDSQFGRVWKKNRLMFPRWWREAVVEDRNDPKWGLNGS